MPLFSPKRNISDTEYKLRVLGCLDALGMATQEQLWPFVAQLEFMDYIPFCMHLGELKTGGAVALAQHALEGMLYLTPAGKEQLRLFSSRMPHTDQQRILEAAPGYAARLNERRIIRTAYERAPKGEYRASCTMSEGDVPALFVRVKASDQLLVQTAVNAFRQYVPHLFTLLFTLPFEPAQTLVPAVGQKEAIASAAPGHPALCAFGGSEHAGAVCLRDADLCLTVMLLFPSAELAWGWACAADQAGAELAREMAALLRSFGGAGA